MNPQEQIRNFAIIAHIDHGKSTLADRLLEKTGTIPPLSMRAQFLDNMELERERGITIKLKAVRMKYGEYILNLVDTPGHVDFSYEVSRSLAACEGALLLVDASQGIQAQTLANFSQAQKLGLTVLPVINKIDLPNAQVSETKEDLVLSLGFEEKDIFLVSAKNGTGVDSLFEGIIQRMPCPHGDSTKPFQALVFDSNYDSHKGVVVYIKVVDGNLTPFHQPAGRRIKFLGTGAESEVIELGYFSPDMKKSDCLLAGDIGYIATGLKEISACRVGDTIIQLPTTGYSLPITPLPGYKKVKPMVFMGLYPIENAQFLHLKEALFKLALNDASLTFTPENSPALGNGFRCGFLGLLHADIVKERLEREYNLALIATIPTVEYRIRLKEKEEDKEKIIKTPSDFPELSTISEILEPWLALTIFAPIEYIGPLMKIAEERRAIYKNLKYIGNRVKMEYEMPLSELIIDFYDQLKSASQGYASVDYDFLDFRPVEAVKLDILVAQEKIEAFSQIVVKDRAFVIGRNVVRKLKEVIPKQQFKVSLQAATGGKIVAREDIPAFRKDVTQKLYGGDYTRKMKLLEKQKKGKKKMKQIGKIHLPQEAFLAVFRRG